MQCGVNVNCLVQSRFQLNRTPTPFGFGQLNFAKTHSDIVYIICCVYDGATEPTELPAICSTVIIINTRNYEYVYEI